MQQSIKAANTTRRMASARVSTAHIVVWAALVLVGGMLAGLSVARYRGYNASMFDLGNMTQAIASVARGEPLVFTFSSGQMSRLALHVELIYFLLGPFYALWPDPQLLIVLQAALFGLGALPVYALVLRHVQSPHIACCMALCYLFYPAAQSGVLFDIHGDTLAMPLLLFALDALDQRAWRRYALFLALALSCKVYVALPVMLMGLPIWWRYRNRRVALLTTSAGVMYGFLAFFVIRPLFTTSQTSDLHRGIHYFSFYFNQFQDVIATLDVRVANVLVVFGPLVLLAWRGWRWLAPALPIAAAALLSNVGSSYDYRSHHYGLVVPFILMAAIEGARQLHARETTQRHAAMPASSGQPGAAPNCKSQRRRTLRGDVQVSLAIVLIFNVLLIDTPLNPLFWLGRPNDGLDHSVYSRTSRDQVKDRFLAEEIPPDAALATSLYLAPHLTNRETLFMLRYPVGQGTPALSSMVPQVAYVLADGLFDFRQITPEGAIDGGATSEQQVIGQMMGRADFGLVRARDGLLLFTRDPEAAQVLAQHAALVQASASPQTKLNDSISLGDVQITPLGGRRFRAVFTWHCIGSIPVHSFYAAVSALDGVDDARVLHLPSYTLLPTSQWRQGQIVRETFDVEFPAEVPSGRYTWRVGWYDLNTLEGQATDQRSLVGTTHAVAEITLP